MKITTLLRSLLYILAVVAVGSGCAGGTLESRMPVYDQSLTTAPLPEGSARVCLARRFDLFHITSQYICDSGSGISYNAKLIRYEDISVQPNDNSWLVHIESKYPAPKKQYNFFKEHTPMFFVLPEPMLEDKSNVARSRNDNFSYTLRSEIKGSSPIFGTTIETKYLDLFFGKSVSRQLPVPG